MPRRCPDARGKEKGRLTAAWTGKGGRGWTGRTGRMSSFRPALPAPPAFPALRSAQTFVDFRPVDDVPPRVDVVRPPVLILQIVGVLPDVDAEHDLLAVHQRAVLIG